MAGTHRTCEICGIKERSINEKRFFARFPLDKQRCSEWIKVVGKEDLAYLPIEKLHDLRHICEIHFAKRDFTKSKTRLKKHAIPKLHLSTAPQLNDDIIAEFLQLNSHVCESEPPRDISTQDICHVPVVASTSAMESDLTENLEKEEIVETVCESEPSRDVSTQAICHVPVVASTSAMESDLTENLEKEEIVETVPVPMDTTEMATMTTKKRPLGSSDQIYTDGQSKVKKCASRFVEKRRKLTETDFNEHELQILNQLKETKSTIKSLRKSSKLIDSIESPLLKEMVMMVLKNQKRKPRGRRWSLKYKISLLGIMKRSPRAYKYLQYLMPLPCVSTLTNILKKIPMEPGICQHVMDQLKNKCPKEPQDKVCCLLFDEIAIKPRLLYNTGTDKIEGYTDLGDGERTPDLADHALVFMLQGLKKKFKQPIAFYFVKGTISSHKLAELIIKIIKSVSETGYRVLNTVCDQGPTNMGAIQILIKLSAPAPELAENNYFIVNNSKIFIIYDVPHLFKSIRNNFLNYGAMSFNGKVAKWEHLHKVEEKNRNLLYLSKISQIHVQPKYRAKMKVKYAAQILSNTVSAVLKLIALADKDNAEDLMNTAVVIQDLDKLFDATNGPSGPDDVKKGLRQNVSKKTDHVAVWTELRKKMESVTFFKSATGAKATNVRCIKGFVVTLCSLRDIWYECQRLGFRYLNLRQLNQDALENLFGIIRQHSPTNRNPTASSFIAALKSSIVSNLTAPHSRGANCLKDSNQLLINFNDDLEDKEDNVNKDISDQENCDPAEDHSFPVLSLQEIMNQEDTEELEDDIINLDEQPVAYLSGYLGYKMKQKVKCALCLETIIIHPDNAKSSKYQYIKLREWWNDKDSLTYPSDNLYDLVKSCVCTFENNLISTMHVLNIRLASVTMFLANNYTVETQLGCDEHKNNFVDSILTHLAIILIRRHCDRINKKNVLEEEKLADTLKKGEQRGASTNLTD